MLHYYPQAGKNWTQKNLPGALLYTTHIVFT